MSHTTTPPPQRNDPCPCGSGKKYKKCCMGLAAATQAEPKESAETIFAHAIRAFEAGQLELSAQIFQQLLSKKQLKADATHYLGLIDFQLGRQENGVRLLQESLRLDPNNASYLRNLGAAYAESGNSPAAITALRKAIQLDPSQANAYSNLGKALQDQGDLTAAVAQYRKALELSRFHADALYNLGVALFKQGDYQGAATTLLDLLEHSAGHADAMCYLGMCAENLGDTANAVQFLRHAIALVPDNYTYYLNLAVILKNHEAPAEAIPCLEKAAELSPEHAASIYCDIGITCAKLGQLDAAQDYTQRALRLDPSLDMAHFNLGFINFSLGHADNAVACYRRSIELNPDNLIAYSNLLFSLQFSRGVTDPQLFEEHRRYAHTFEPALRPLHKTFKNDPAPGRKLRIGYVSADFNNHSLAPFIRPILTHHDKRNFEVFCYYNHTLDDDVTRDLRSCADHWIPCAHLADDALAQRIEQDGIDILLDLAGHTERNRLLVFARKPAPVQITWLGYAGTTGLEAMDYRITDPYLDPPGISDQYHSERLIRLSASTTFDSTTAAPDVAPLPALNGQPFTYGCLNSLAKVSDENIALWAEILDSTPGSRLMLGNAGQAAIREQLISRFSRHGVGEERLLLQPRVSTYDFLALHHHIDLALDPFPYNGGTTTIQALRMGVPVVTLEGVRPVSRCGTAIMHAIGLPEFVATDSRQYSQIARHWFNDREALGRLRLTLRERWQHSAYGDPISYTREVESAYRQAWQRWVSQSGQ